MLINLQAPSPHSLHRSLPPAHKHVEADSGVARSLPFVNTINTRKCSTGFIPVLAGLWAAATENRHRRRSAVLVRPLAFSQLNQNRASHDLTKSSESGSSASLMLWAFLVGASVSARLWCSVELTSTVAGMDSFVASCHVASRSMLLSALCLAPFASFQNIPKTSGPWLAGICTLPSASLIASSKVLGLGLTQMLLKLSTLSTAISLDAVSGQFSGGFTQRLLGTAVVLAGVAVAAFWGQAGASFAMGPVFWVCLAGTAVSGAGFVLQARLSAEGGQARRPGAPASEAEAEAATAAMVCQLVSAGVQVILLCLLSWQGFTTILGLPMLLKDTPLWLFEGLQGAFFLRSMQVLGKRLGLATTFTLSLSGQLITAAVIDVLQGSNTAFLASRMAGLALVVCGAAISARSPTKKTTSQTRVLDVRALDPRLNFSGDAVKRVGNANLDKQQSVA